MEFAIVGAAIRLPRIVDIDEFDVALLAGQSGLREVSPQESLRNGASPAEIADPLYVPVASSVESAELFDRDFFGMTAGEAASVDPQHRLLLTLAHEALDSWCPDRERMRIGVYTSVTLSGRYVHPRVDDGSDASHQALLGNDKDFCSSRIAYKLGLTGPAAAVQSACSSALLAVHQACSALAFGDADAMIVGGASVSVPQSRGYRYQAGGVLSPTGQCRPFDVGSNGTLKGNGAGAVILRRLDHAIADGDPILAVISGSAVNNDGDERMGFTAPSARGQQRVIAAALERAGVDPVDVRYVETHGTGTQLGDPIEFRALAKTYGADASVGSDCQLRSLKSNFGHLDAAAGIVGLIKAVLVVRTGRVYPQTNFTAANPLMNLADTRFEVSSNTRAFPTGAWAGVSAMGMGGTNCHVILRAARRDERVDVGREPSTDEPVELVVSARTPALAQSFGRRLAGYLRRHPAIEPVDVAATLARRSVRDVAYRLRVRGHAELVAALESVTESVTESVMASAPAAKEHPAQVGGRRIWLPPAPLLEVQVDVLRPAADGPPEPGILGLRADCFRMMSDELGTTVDSSTDFFDEGGESVAFVEVVSRLAAKHEFVADFDRLDGLSLAGEIAAELQRQVLTAAPLRSGDAVLEFGPSSHVYWHPPAGGSNFCYAALSRLDRSLGFNAFRADRAAGPQPIEQIAARNIGVLERRGALSEELVLGGYSFGGNVGLEMAFQLERAGVRPSKLVLFDSIPPMAYQGADRTDADHDEGIRMVIRHGVRGRGGRAGDGGDDELVFSRLIGDDGTPAGTTLREFAVLWRSNQRALAAYKPDGVLSCPIVIFSTAQPLSPDEHRWLGIEDLPATEWQRYTSAPLDVIAVPGDHYSMFTDRECTKVIASLLPAHLAAGSNA